MKQGVEEDLKEAKAKRVISKPLNMPQLLVNIRKIIDECR